MILAMKPSFRIPAQGHGKQYTWLSPFLSNQTQNLIGPLIILSRDKLRPMYPVYSLQRWAIALLIVNHIEITADMDRMRKS